MNAASRLRPQFAADLQGRLLRWYQRHGRDLPWRRTRDPYAIAVSEVMLQQTQVDRVIPKYRLWLRRFPTWSVLARAPLRRVLQTWSGLGYNNRAVRLRRLATIVVRDFNARLPDERASLEQLPGIGRYTAGAIAAFAFTQPAAVVDTNIRRVLTRLFFGDKHVAETRIEKIAEKVIPATQADQWNHGLMDLGALVCIARRPRCEVCPLKTRCRAYPAILNRPVSKHQPTAVPFEQSDRYVRGRITALIAQRGSMLRTRLFDHLKAGRGITQRRFQRIVKGLVRDGLIEVTGRKITVGS